MATSTARSDTRQRRTRSSASDTEASGTEASGTEATGTEATGTEATGTEATGTEAADGGQRTATVNLPFVTAQFRAPEIHLPHVHVPGRQEVGALAQTARSMLPSPKTVLYFGGLAALAAIEVIEWPVAAAIAVGTAIARSDRGGQTGGSGSTTTQADTSALTERRESTAKSPS
jgi:hypothetical protein